MVKNSEKVIIDKIVKTSEIVIIDKIVKILKW
jgi:hypothetical protein